MKKNINKLLVLFSIIMFSNTTYSQKLTATVDTYIDKTVSQATLAQGAAESANLGKLILRKSGAYERIIFFEFKLPDLKQPITTSELNLYLYNVNNVPNSLEIVDVYEVISGDIIDYATWENFNDKYILSSDPVATLTINTGSVLTDTYGWYKIELKEVVSKIISTPNSKKVLKLALKAKSGNLMLTFYSSDYSPYTKYRPFLNIK